MNKSIFLFIFFIITFSNFQKAESDDSYVKTFFDAIESLDINKAEETLDNIKSLELNKKLKIYFDVKKNNGYQLHTSQRYIKSIKLEKRITDINYLIDILILIEDSILYKHDRIRAYDLAYKGYKSSEKIGSDFFQTQFILSILKIYRTSIINTDENIDFYLNKLFELNEGNTLYLFKYYYYKIYLNEIGLLKGDDKNKIINRRNISHKAIKKLDSVSTLLTPSQKKLFIELYQTKGLNELSKKKYQIAHIYFLKGFNLLSREKNIFYNSYKYENLKETARNLGKKGNYKKAIKYLRKSKSFQSKLTSSKNSFVYNLYISNLYYNLKLKDSAYLAMKSAFQKSLHLNFEKQNKLISSLEIKNKTAEKEKQILISEQKRKQNQNLFYGALSFLFLGGVIAFLSLKNSRKKRLLAEQQQELEQQKNITLIKEQEIMAINAMIEGQEKERQIIAEDLHDNIGSVLATLKLHFENLKLNRKKKHFNQEELYNRTEKLIDETYLKVRSIAHAKNAGVIANQGLLVSVKLMAEKISSANKTQIEVLDYGLEKRIENTIELTAFRVIQELTTNIIKHANATKATINISLFDKILNIIIEDNGKGFNFKDTNLNNGMGLHAIQKKVKHLNGTFEVDSTLNKGTTIIINIPETNT